MDNQYTFTQEDMQRLTAIIHIDDERRVPEQVMNALEKLLAKPDLRPWTQPTSVYLKPGHAERDGVLGRDGGSNRQDD